MLDTALQNQLRDYFKKLEQPVVLRAYPGEHEKKAELHAMLNDIAALSDSISIETADESAAATEDNAQSTLQGPLRFDVLGQNRETGIRFSGIPGGHEFSSLILAILQTGGSPLKLDGGIQKFARGIGVELRFQTVVSLSCHNCPDVVQTLNSLSLLNDNISHEMVEGGVFPEFVEKHQVQGVPAVFLNGEPFANGKLDAGQIIDKLIQHLPKDATNAQANGASDASAAGADADDAALDEAAEFDVVVVGGGPAGVASAIYSARKGLKVAVVADRLGGQVKDTMGIENLIALAKTTGPELTQSLAELLGSHDISVKEHLRVESIQTGESTTDRKTVVLNTGERLATHTVILATGAKWRELNVPGEKEFLGKGVAYCPHCDGPFFKGKDVAVVGGGNSGVEAALDLAGIVKSVTVVEFSDSLKADQILLERLERTENISAIVNAATSEVLNDGQKVTGLKYKDRAGQDESRETEVEVDGIFVQIGLLPNTGFVKDLVECNRFGEIEIDAACRTNVPGIFACGDATTTPYKQIVVALGEGAKASLSAFEYLLKLPQPAEAAEKSAGEAVAVA
ncbi:MAG: alkyl hydroperoxide reductase subunit F [bacterium]|nr:alkyl hydroperoxide reductase subunit F [bacterium]